MMDPQDQAAIDRSLVDALKIARRLSRCFNGEAYSAALAFIRELRRLGARQKDARDVV